MADRVRTAVDEVTVFTLFTPTEITPRHDRKRVLDVLQVTERTLQNYLRELRPKGCLTVTEGEGGRTLFSDEDIAFLHRYKAAKSARAKAGMADSQRERIAQLCAGTSGRVEAQAIRRELRALADSGHLPSVPRRIAALLERVPHLRTARSRVQKVWYFNTYHGTSELAKHDSLEAPETSTVERAWRRVK